MSAPRINFKKLDTDTAIDAAIIAVHGRWGQLRTDIQLILVAIGARWAASGDSRHFPGQINKLINDMPEGVHTNALRAWAEKNFGMIYNEETKLMVAGKLTSKELSIKDIANNHWWEAKAQAPYEGWNMIDAAHKLIKTATTKAKAGKAEDFIPNELINMMAKTIAEYEAMMLLKADAIVPADKVAKARVAKAA